MDYEQGGVTRERILTVYDESLRRAESRIMRMVSLKAARGAIRDVYSENPKHKAHKWVKFLDELINKCFEEKKRLKDKDESPLFDLPYRDEAETKQLREMIPSVARHVIGHSRDTLLTIAELIGRKVRFEACGNDAGALWYDIRVPRLCQTGKPHYRRLSLKTQRSIKFYC